MLVQIHGLLQLFGFAGLFAIGVALHALPRFRAARPPSTAIRAAAYLGTVVGLALRVIAQPLPDLSGRTVVLAGGGVLLIGGAVAFASAAIRSLASGRNPHRPDELVIGAGICALPVAALLVALEMAGAAPVLVDQAVDDRAVWVMLLGFLATLVFGVWARLAPGFVAAMPARRGPLIGGAALWLAGVVALALDLRQGPVLLLAGLALLTWTLGVFATGIARQPLHGHARLTRLGVRSAFSGPSSGSASSRLARWVLDRRTSRSRRRGMRSRSASSRCRSIRSAPGPSRRSSDDASGASACTWRRSRRRSSASRCVSYHRPSSRQAA